MPTHLIDCRVAINTFFCLAVLLLSYATSAEAGVNKLRSAYLGTDVWTEALSSEEINKQLREHFSSVLQILEGQNASSLLLALRRAEASASRPWTDSQRRHALITLVKRRQMQIVRLQAYAHLGRFPQNEGQSAQAAPIFVDRNGTRCAVGHLMHSDGHSYAVANIAFSDNLIRVMEVRKGALARWVLTSGLTQEEAAIIQPAYPIDLDASLEDFLTTSPTVTKDNISLSNLTFKRVELAIDSSENMSTLDAIDAAWERGKTELATAVPLSFAGNAGAIIGSGDLNVDGFIIPSRPNRLNDWLYVGPASALNGSLLGGRESAFENGYAQMIEVEYDLQISDSRFSNFAFSHYLGIPVGPASEYGSFKILSEIYDGESSDLIGQAEAAQTGPEITFAPVQSNIVDLATSRIRVKTYGLTLAEDADQNEVSVHSIFYELGSSAVPEPGTITIVISAATLLSMPRRQRAS